MKMAQRSSRHSPVCMPSKLHQFWRNPSYRRLSLALLVSALLHLWLVKGLGLHYPGWWSEPEATVSTIQAVLLPPPKPEPVAVAAAPAPKPVAKSRPAKKLIKPAPPPASAPVEAPQQQVSPPPEQMTEPEEPRQEEAPAEEFPPVQPEEAIDDGAARISSAPAYVKTDFVVSKGTARGVMHNTYEMQPGGSYILKSEAEAQGFISLFLGTLKQQSEGVVTEQGLRPYRYLYQYGDSEDKAQRANFDWRSQKLTMQNGKKTRTEPLEAGTQDLLSFMYQFMFVPPLEQMQLSITNGKKLSTYSYAFAGEETLSTKMGDLRTVHIFRTRGDSDEKTELWLALDYFNLPVKVRQTDKDGGVIEQIATRISTGNSDPEPEKPAP